MSEKRIDVPAKDGKKMGPIAQALSLVSDLTSSSTLMGPSRMLLRSRMNQDMAATIY